MHPRPVLALVATALCLCGCGAGAPDGSPVPAPPAASSAATFGGTDRAWVEINIAMGEELLPLLDLAPSRSRDAEVRALAADAKALHLTELAALYELHAAAGLPSENPHKGMPMPGMVTPEQVAAASASTGPAFDELLSGPSPRASRSGRPAGHQRTDLGARAANQGAGRADDRGPRRNGRSGTRFRNVNMISGQFLRRFLLSRVPVAVRVPLPQFADGHG